MLGKQTVKQAIGVDVAISEPMISALELWSKMYHNQAPWINKEIVSLNLPAAIASEIARLATLELEVKIEGSPRADYLSEQFEKVLDRIRSVIEFGCAKGGLVFKPYVSGKNIIVDYIQADQFLPVSFDTNGRVTSCVFVDQRKQGDYYYTRLESHALEEDGCTIKNIAYRSNLIDILGSKVELGAVPDWVDLEPEAFISGIDKPLFSYFRYPTANNIDATSPLGVSCYARAIDLIRQADLQWFDLMWEFESGERALYVDVLAFGKDSKGRPILPQKRLYRAMETGSAEGDLYHEWTPNLREQNIINGLNRILKQIEFTCGLAYGTLSDPNQVEKTATEIASARQRTYATVVDTQKAVQNALDDLLYAMDTWTTLAKLAPKGKYEVTYQFDDSIVVDKDASFQQDLRLVAQGIMSPVEFRMRNLGEDEETAKQKIAEIPSTNTDLFQGI
jgi:A118 family predicted phage portal protein